MVKPEGRRALGRRRLRWGNNIKVRLQEMELAWFGLIRLAIVTNGRLFLTQ